MRSRERGLTFTRPHDDTNAMQGLLHAITRLFLWLVISVPVTYAALWLLEHLMVGGVLGPHVLSVWFSVAGVTLAVAAGAVVAYGFDRVYRRHLAGPVGR